MKVSLNWLTDYVKVSMPAKELADLFLRIGFPVEEIVETDTDIVLDLEVTSNRPDLLGYIGVARELAAATGETFTPPKIGRLPTVGSVEDLTSVEVQDPDLCPRYTARVIRNITVGPSPKWMIERLEAVGLRGINNIVDATNYVLMEYSQPLHCFDYDKLTEHRIVVRRGRQGETMVSIDQTTCRLDDQMLIIADARRPVAIAGVMGGLDTEFGEATRNVLIESAQFDPLVTRRTSRRLAIMSESNYRFERGVDPVGVDAASLRACQLILELAGGELADGVADVWAKPFKPARLALRPARTNALLGVKIPQARQVAILRRLGLAPKPQRGRIVCAIPSHRGDLTREADLIEEVARLEGYDKIPVFDRVTHTVVSEPPTQRVRRGVAAALAAAGFDEAVTVGFIDAKEADLFGCTDAIAVDTLTRKTNNTLRPTLLPSLLGVCKTNQDAGNGEVSLYELAAVFVPRAGAALPDEHTELAMVSSSGLRELRGALEAVIARNAAGGRLEIRPGAVRGLDGQAAAEVLLDDRPIGIIGPVAADVLDHYGLERPLAAAAIRFDALLARGGQVASFQALPRFPSVRRDLSLIVADATTWGKLAEAVAAVEQPLRVGVDYVTTYRGKPIPEGHKSVTVTLTYRSQTETLRGEQVDEQVAQVLGALKDALAAELRA
ncbi:MAG TPA: phenylalanine--tRNA ligase subunit beta [Phycisphaerae bacterium]|nr:phenylalanine--tRNA ligase subunit beta [Phycisphaerae bacterium]